MAGDMARETEEGRTAAVNEKNMEVLVNIVGAVESGGQIYGHRNYQAYADPYKNSPIEHTITLGWPQFYGPRAQELLRRTKEKDPKTFATLDNAGISAMLSKDWVAMRWNPTAAQKKAILYILSSSACMAVQDEMFKESAKSEIADCERTYTKEPKAVMMYVETRHLGGKSAVDRIFKRCNGNYSVGNILASLKKDQLDTSNNNQVGDQKFWSRHKKCAEFAIQYAVSENDSAAKDSNNSAAKVTDTKEVSKMSYSRQKVVDLITSWEGKKESDGSYKSIIDTYNTLPASKLPRGVKMAYGWAWCACTWSAVAIKLGYTAIMPIEISCYFLIENAKKMGCWVENDAYIPSPGDAVLYDWGDGSNYANTDNMGTPDHVGTVIAVDKAKGTFTAMEGNKNDSVSRRTVAINGRYIRGFIVPKYTDNAVKPAAATAAETGSAAAASAVSKIPGTCKVTLKQFLCGAKDPQVRAIQRILNDLGYKGKDGKALIVDGELGANTAAAITEFQKAKGMKDINFGTVAAKTWEYLLNA